jgi:hypothetical protein
VHAAFLKQFTNAINLVNGCVVDDEYREWEEPLVHA